MATSLSEQRRAQLDSIVMKMEANKEKPEAIQFVVNDFKTKYAGEGAQPQQDGRGLIRKAWDAASVPSQMAERGINQLADLLPEPPEPTGNLPVDLVRGAKPIIQKAGLQAMGKVAAGEVNPLSLALMGLGQGAKAVGSIPAVRSMGSGVAKQMESLSGAVPGSIEAVAKDASLLGAKGKKAVQGMYQKAKELGGPVRESLEEISDKKQQVEEAFALAKKGDLNPSEALEARKTLAKIKNKVTDSFFRKANGAFDSVAKTVFKESDKAYQEANMAESLRNVFPQNKYGGTSAFKLGLQSISNSDSVAGLLFRLALSPLAQGTAAATAGATARGLTSARNAVGAGALIKAIQDLRKK